MITRRGDKQRKTGIYMRVSTNHQHLDGQRLQITNYLRDHGIESDAVVWYEDHGQGGDTLSRPAMERLQRDIAAGRINSVIVSKLDRLSRTLSDGINLLTGWLSRGVRVIAITQQLDFSGATGQLIASVLLGVAQMEQETRRERQAAGIEAAKARGVYKGRKVGTTKVEPAKIRDLLNRGFTIVQVAKVLGISRKTVYRWKDDTSERQQAS